MLCAFYEKSRTHIFIVWIICYMLTNVIFMVDNILDSINQIVNRKRSINVFFAKNVHDCFSLYYSDLSESLYLFTLLHIKKIRQADT